MPTLSWSICQQHQASWACAYEASKEVFSYGYIAFSTSYTFGTGITTSHYGRIAYITCFINLTNYILYHINHNTTKADVMGRNSHGRNRPLRLRAYRALHWNTVFLLLHPLRFCYTKNRPIALRCPPPLQQWNLTSLLKTFTPDFMESPGLRASPPYESACLLLFLLAFAKLASQPISNHLLAMALPALHRCQWPH